MGKQLIIVESPAKAKTIGKILGSDFVVKSSVGHIRDLPERTLGVDVDAGFVPKYVLSKGKSKVVAELKKVVTPTRKEFATYVGVVLAFVVIMMIIISTFDLGVGVLVNSIFG